MSKRGKKKPKNHAADDDNNSNNNVFSYFICGLFDQIKRMKEIANAEQLKTISQSAKNGKDK